LRVYLVHHAEAVGPDVDPQRPLSPLGRQQAEKIALEAARRGVRPDVIWHSGKLRARQTAKIFWRACNPLAEFAAARDLQPADRPTTMRDRLRHEPRTVMLVGHFPHLPALLALLLEHADGQVPFPPHGIVTLRTDDEGDSWTEEWRIAPNPEFR
jgi:phosphohistidine phosphatase